MTKRLSWDLNPRPGPKICGHKHYENIASFGGHMSLSSDYGDSRGFKSPVLPVGIQPAEIMSSLSNRENLIQGIG